MYFSRHGSDEGHTGLLVCSTVFMTLVNRRSLKNLQFGADDIS